MKSIQTILYFIESNIEVEFCYAPVEGEALVYRLESCRIFVMGSPDLLVSVDHKPLVKIFPDKALEDTKKTPKN